MAQQVSGENAVPAAALAGSPEIGKNIVVGGIRTNYLEAGSGDTVILVHGSGPGVTAYANWRLVIPALAERFHVLAPDIVGFGYTDVPEGFRYELDDWVAHLRGFAEATGVNRFHIIGNSFGGALAIAVAHRHPELVDRIVLMGSVGVDFPITEGLEAVWGYEPSRPAMLALIELFAYNHDLITPDLTESRYKASIREDVQKRFSSMFPAPRQDRVRALATPEQEISKLSNPTLILHGRDDKVIPVENGIRLNRLIENSELHVFGKCGHWTQIERTSEFSKLVVDFLTR